MCVCACVRMYMRFCAVYFVVALLHVCYRSFVCLQLAPLNNCRDSFCFCRTSTLLLPLQNGVGMDDPLLDKAGFPRSDIDVHAVRIARHDIAGNPKTECAYIYSTVEYFIILFFPSFFFIIRMNSHSVIHSFIHFKWPQQNVPSVKGDPR